MDKKVCVYSDSEPESEHSGSYEFGDFQCGCSWCRFHNNLEDRYEFPGNIIDDEDLEKMEVYPYWEKYYFNNLLFHLEQKFESCKPFRLNIVNWNDYWVNEYDLHFIEKNKFEEFMNDDKCWCGNCK